ncbi:MAG: MAPEG family protein [Proteobacteria bacterium]|nr:MAPEG family protein [Pseudomonadota bacterium]
MHGFEWTSLATAAALVVYMFMSIRVGVARAKYKVAAPAMSGDPMFERHVRVHLNTLEWLPVFLPSMWMFAMYWSDAIAAGIGVVWILGRILYMMLYVNDPKTRSFGFGIQAIATFVLLGGAIWGAASALIHMP